MTDTKDTKDTTYKFDPSLYTKVDVLVQKDRKTNKLKRTSAGETLRNSKITR